MPALTFSSYLSFCYIELLEAFVGNRLQASEIGSKSDLCSLFFLNYKGFILAHSLRWSTAHQSVKAWQHIIHRGGKGWQQDTSDLSFVHSLLLPCLCTVYETGYNSLKMMCIIGCLAASLAFAKDVKIQNCFRYYDMFSKGLKLRLIENHHWGT